jgi:hypothetical protein
LRPSVRSYGADDVAGTDTDIAGASLDEGASTETDIAGASEEDGAADDEETAGASDEDGAADDDGAGASLDTTAELEGATGVTGVGVPRLKIQMRPIITITATMTIIQVLRFIRACLVLEETRPGSCLSALTLGRLPYSRLAILIRHWRH